MEECNILFDDEDEKELSVLGSKYLKRFFATGSMADGFCVLSDKRVYFKGRCYSKVTNDFKMLKTLNDEKVVELPDINESRFTLSRYFIFKIIALILLILDIFVYGILHISKLSFLHAVFFVILPLVVDIALYYTLQVKLYEIAFNGGRIVFKVSEYDENEIQEFQKALKKAKSDYKVTKNQKEKRDNILNGVYGNISIADEIKKYKELLDCEAITKEEFNIQKERLLNAR